MDKKIESILKEIRIGLEKIYGKRLKGAFLYGSYARGEAEKGSDMDIAIVLDNFEDPWKEIESTGELVSGLSLKYGVVLCLLPLRERDFLNRNSPLIMNVKKEGIPLR
ncbi:MAG TPA: nucleotidyltransferase domain-containing protein [Candidatus Hypogeohydataceae bacterium YC41]